MDRLLKVSALQNTAGASDVKFYTYDEEGNLTVSVNETGGTTSSTSSAPVITTTNEYNVDNMICWTTTQVVSSPSCSSIPSGSNTASYSYDSDMNLTAVTDANSIPTTYAYDSQNRMSSQTMTTGTTINYAYDGQGNTLAADYSTGVANLYSYNADNLVTSRTLGEPGDLASIQNSSCGGYIPFYGVYSTYCSVIGTDIFGKQVLISGVPGSFTSVYPPSGTQSLSGISCATQQTCFATGLGSTSPLILTTSNSGSSWSQVSATFPNGTTNLGSIACPSTSMCFVAATVSASSEILATSNGGSTWSQLSGSGVPTWALNSISCPSTTECYFSGNNGTSGEISQWISGNSPPFISQAFASTTLNSLSCANATQCVAVGMSSSSAVIEETVGSNSWSSVSNPSGTSYANLLSVSCPSSSALSNCYSVGTNTSLSPVIAGITYSNSTWSASDQTSAIPYGTGALATIGCGYSSTCMALGATSFGSGQILYTANNGSSWPEQFHLDEYSYSTEGHLLSLEDGIGTSGNISYSYDSLGRLISQTDEYGVTTSYGYDLNSNLTSVTYPGSSHVVTRTFNAANELTNVQTWLTGPGTCGTYSIPTDETSFTYDNNGNPVSETFPTCDTKNVPNSPDTVDFSVDNNNYITDLYGKWNNNNDSAVYTNNAAGMIDVRNIDSGYNTTSYSYNNLGQVSAVANPNETFSYDSAGNMTCNQGGQNQTYNSVGELNYAYQNCGSTANQQDSFTYDAYGDRTQEMFPFNGQNVPEDYIFTNSLGEMVEYEAFFTATNYSYSGTNQLMQIYQGSTVLSQMTWNDASATPQILSDSKWDFIYGPGNRVIEAINVSTSTQYYLVNDPSGSVLFNFSQNGTVNSVNLYNTYGATPSGAPPIGWDNAYIDPASSLYFMNNRFYDSNTGQFITVDPRVLALNQPFGYAGYVSSSSEGMSRSSSPFLTNNAQPYQFANDDPVNINDPSGLCGHSMCLFAFAGMVATGALGGALSSFGFYATFVTLADAGEGASGLIGVMGISPLVATGLTPVIMSTALSYYEYKKNCI